MRKNLFQAVKTYINGVDLGETFTTRHLIDTVGDHETSTWWKEFHQNPYYRTHTYKSYLKRAGFLSNPKQGVWKVEKHIPDFVNLGTVEFLIGFGYKTKYNGLTRAETILNINCGYSVPNEVEDRLEKIIDGETTQQLLSEIGMEGQMLSQLIMTQPIEEIRYLVEERENLDKIRILSEIKEDKIMKVEFDFVEGIERIKKYLKNSLQQEEEFLFRDVKLCNDKDDLKQVIVDFELSERRIEQAIECLEDAGCISDVFIAVEDTTLSGLDETVIGLLFNIDITVR
jgi:hypothetical protein